MWSRIIGLLLYAQIVLLAVTLFAVVAEGGFGGPVSTVLIWVLLGVSVLIGLAVIADAIDTFRRI